MGNEPATPIYAELLQRALSLGLQELDSAIVQLPGDASCRRAVVLATARMREGVLLRAAGEAYADGEAGDDRRTLVTTAESRAKTRVLSEVMCLVAQSDGAAESSADGDLVDLAIRTAGGDADLRPGTGEHAATRIVEGGDHGQIAVPLSVMASSGESVETVGRDGAEQWTSPARRLAGEPFGAEVGRSLAQAVARKADSDPARGNLGVEAPIGPDVLTRLLHLTRRKAETEGAPISEEEAMQRIDSYFQRAFGHPVAEGSQIEGQRVVQRLMSGAGRALASHAQAPRR